MAGFNFGVTADILKDAIAGSGLAHDAIANNIANVNTPGFQRIEVTFKQALAATEPTPPDPNELSLATTSPLHIPINGEIAAQPFHVTASPVDNPVRMRVDGSNVDVDQEMALLTQNSAYQQTAAQLLQSQYTRLRTSIEERA